MWNAILDFILKRINPRDLVGKLIKYLDEQSHKTEAKWDDVTADMLVELYDKFNFIIPESISLQIRKIMKAR